MKPRDMKAFCSLFLFLLFAMPVLAAAETKPAFFEALYDVPVMPGLSEFKDQAMLFDKPNGRIASVVAGSEKLKPADVSRFYNETMPQMGWQKTSENQYVRGHDRLVIEVVSKPPLTIAHFTLSPAGAR